MDDEERDWTDDEMLAEWHASLDEAAITRQIEAAMLAAALAADPDNDLPW
jgi:hypothetical protein